MSSTRQQFIETMAGLLAAQGYHGTGLNQVVRESGAPKGSLYYHFPGGKEELAAEAIARVGAELAERIDRAMEAEADPLAGLGRLVLDAAERLQDASYVRGGPVAAVALETAGQSEVLTEACAAVYDLWERRIVERLRAAGLHAEISARLATAVVALLEGATVLARARRDVAPLQILARFIPALAAQDVPAPDEVLRAVEAGAAAAPAGPVEPVVLAEHRGAREASPRPEGDGVPPEAEDARQDLHVQGPAPAGPEEGVERERAAQTPAYVAPQERAGEVVGVEEERGLSLGSADGTEDAWQDGRSVAPERDTAAEMLAPTGVPDASLQAEAPAIEAEDVPAGEPSAPATEPPVPEGGTTPETPDEVPATLLYSRSLQRAVGPIRAPDVAKREGETSGREAEPQEALRRPEAPGVADEGHESPDATEGRAAVAGDQVVEDAERAEAKAATEAEAPRAPTLVRERRRHPRRITIFGASGRVGSRLLEQSLASGYTVTAFVREANRIWVRHERLRVVEGDLRDAEVVADAVKGADAVICALGTVQDDEGNALTVATQNIVAAMRRHGVARLVALAGIEVTSTRDEPSAGRSLLLGVKRMLGGSSVRDAEGMVQVIRSSELEWTIVRAPRLTNRRRSGDYRVGYLPVGPRSSISRADVAAFMLSQLSDEAYLCQMPMITQ